MLLPHTMMFQDFRRKMARRPLPPFNGKASDSMEIEKRISPACATRRISSAITVLLVDYMRSKDSLFTGLRATARTVVRDSIFWTIVEWIEPDGTIAMVIFHFDGSEKQQEQGGSWLMHRGILPDDTKDEEEWRLPWKGEQVSWNVEEISHLKSIFGVLQYTLGEMELPGQWPASFGQEANLTYGPYRANPNFSPSAPPPKLVFEIQLMAALFEQAVPALTSLGKIEGRFIFCISFVFQVDSDAM